jgi:sugar lactone lactonase YvrE
MVRATVILGILTMFILSFTLSAAAAPPDTFPSLIPLPNGFRPEGIAVGRGTDFFVGSIPTGAVYRGDLRTGQGDILVPAQVGRAAIGLSVDRRTNFLFVAGGPTGHGYVYDAATGATVADYEFATSGTFVNDVIVTRSAAYFTDSFRPYLYRVPLSAGGALPDQTAVDEIELTGDFVYVPGPGVFNTNGIDATPNGKRLFIVHSTRGELYRVNPKTGEATLVDLGGGSVPNGDGILLDGKTLYVMQNRLNQIAVVELDPKLTAGEITGTITDPDFDVPTTIAEFGSALYAVNARFGTTMPDTAEYDVVRVSK